MDRWGRTAGTSQTPVAAGCGGTRCGWRALQAKGTLQIYFTVINPTRRDQKHRRLGLSPLASRYNNLLISPLHCQAILLWQEAPGLLKSHAAQVASSTIADGCKSRSIEFHAFQYFSSRGSFLCVYLQAVGEDDIGVHCPNVQMVDKGAFNPVWDLLQGSQLIFNLLTHLGKKTIF